MEEEVAECLRLDRLSNLPRLQQVAMTNSAYGCPNGKTASVSGPGNIYTEPMGPYKDLLAAAQLGQAVIRKTGNRYGRSVKAVQHAHD